LAPSPALESAAATPEAPAEEGDDDLDLFGDETEEEAAAAAEREAAKKAAGTKKKESKFFFLLIFISACWITVYGNCIVLEMQLLKV
jgi:elongation factor 1-beta